MNQQTQLIRISDGQKYELGPETTIGRREDCGIVLEESRVSRLHAQINVTENRIAIEDFSRNGTLLNGTMIEGVTSLQHNDTIRFDREDFQLECPAESPGEIASLTRAPNLTEIAPDAKRMPLPRRPVDEGTNVVFTPPNNEYQPLDCSNYQLPSLVIRNGVSAGKVFTLPDTDNRWTIGSSPNNDIHLADEGVSSCHAVIQRSGNTWEVIDQMSTNVLRVNNSMTNKRYLTSKDKISLGPIDCEIVLPDGYQKWQNHKPKFQKSIFGVIVLIIFMITSALFFYSNISN